MGGVDIALLDQSFRRADLRVLFQLWLVWARTSQQNNALKKKLRSLREDVGQVAASCGPDVEAEASDLVADLDQLTVAAADEEVERVEPQKEAPQQATELSEAKVLVEITPQATAYPENAAPAPAQRKMRPAVTVDVEEAERTAESQELARARDEIFELRAEQKECGRVVDLAMAQCQKLGSQLKESNREVGDLRRRLALAEGRPA